MSSAASPGTVSSTEGKSSWIEMLMWESTCVFVCVYSAIDNPLPEMIICQAASSISLGRGLFLVLNYSLFMQAVKLKLSFVIHENSDLKNKNNKQYNN